MKTFLPLVVVGLAALATNAAAADDLSKSIMRPTSVSSGAVAGNLPGGDGSISYYVAVDLQPGTLMAQLAIAGRPNTGKKLTFELLNAEARVAASTYVMAGLDPKAEATKSFAIDSPGRYIIRLTTEGKETGTYCVLMGGPAMPNATAASCPSTGPVAPTAPVRVEPPVTSPARVVEAPAPPAAAPRRNFEIIASKCEERLRVGSDFLFDFDRAEVRPEAGPTLDEIAAHLAAASHAAMIEGHTDGKGTAARIRSAPRSHPADCRSTISSFEVSAKATRWPRTRGPTVPTILKAGKRTAASRWFWTPADRRSRSQIGRPETHRVSGRLASEGRPEPSGCFPKVTFLPAARATRSKPLLRFLETGQRSPCPRGSACPAASASGRPAPSVNCWRGCRAKSEFD